jgi:dethiobiotin synthetase
MVSSRAIWHLDTDDVEQPRPGDVALVEVESVGNHTALVSNHNERLRLYSGSLFTGVFGNRYATDVFEATVESTDNLCMLTNAGMIGTVRSRNRDAKAPTRVRFKGFVTDREGLRLNLKSRFFRPAAPRTNTRNVILVVGTGMNSGKTTTACRLLKGLADRGTRVAAFKLTGSVSHRDLLEMRSASPVLARDFSDYGFPSTWQCEDDELLSLFHTMMADAEQVDPDVIVMEIADGVLQRETTLLLRNDEIRSRTAGVLLTAPCALSALEAVREVREAGHEPLAVSGIINNAPLFVREFSNRSQVPVLSSLDGCGELASAILASVRAERK